MLRPGRTKRKSRLGKGLCEWTHEASIAHPNGRDCTRRARFWVQRGALNRMSCNVHLTKVIDHLWSLAEGWHGKSEHYEGTLITDRTPVQVKLTESGELWK